MIYPVLALLISGAILFQMLPKRVWGSMLMLAGIYLIFGIGVYHLF